MKSELGGGGPAPSTQHTPPPLPTPSIHPSSRDMSRDSNCTLALQLNGSTLLPQRQARDVKHLCTVT
jgi:hypothetical protein